MTYDYYPLKGLNLSKNYCVSYITMIVINHDSWCPPSGRREDPLLRDRWPTQSTPLVMRAFLASVLQDQWHSDSRRWCLDG
jgi:hypothetical protein